MRRLAAVWTFFVAAVCAAAPGPITTVILVRHAEKAGPAGDVPLSSAGIERANELVRVLAGTSIAAVYTTPYLRTEQTAGPLAKAHVLELIIVKSNDTCAHDLVETIRHDHAGETVVVVGHSNTTVDVLKQLGIANPPAIADSQYDDLFVVTLAGDSAKLISLRYGKAAR
jgi:broad specificity phosphatase PhoE